MPQNLETICIEKSRIENGIVLIDLLVESGIVPSKSESRRMIQQKGISVNGNKEEDINKIIHYNDFVNEELIIQKGKKCFKKIKINNY